MCRIKFKRICIINGLILFLISIIILFNIPPAAALYMIVLSGFLLCGFGPVLAVIDAILVKVMIKEIKACIIGIIGNTFFYMIVLLINNVIITMTEKGSLSIPILITIAETVEFFLIQIVAFIIINVGILLYKKISNKS